MAVTLANMETAVTESNLNGNLSTFGRTKIHLAIRWAAERFLRMTGVTRTVGSYTVANASTAINITSSLTDFRPEYLTNVLRISGQKVKCYQVDLATINRYRARYPSATGIPEIFCFTSASNCEIFPQADAEYTLLVPYAQPFTSFTIGTTDATTLNIPDRYQDIVAMGAAGKLIMGYPGQPDGPARLAMFEQEIAELKSIGDTTGVMYSDLDDNYENTYWIGGYV